MTSGHRGRFEISLSRKPDHGRTSVLDSGRKIATITIQDDDSKFDDNSSLEKSSCFTHFHIEYILIARYIYNYTR